MVTYELNVGDLADNVGDLADNGGDLAGNVGDLAANGGDLADNVGDLAFEWTRERRAAVILDAQGYSVNEIHKQAKVGKRSISRWRKSDKYLEERSLLSQIIGFSSKSERLRLVNKVIRKLSSLETLNSEAFRKYKTLLDYLNYARQETEAIKLELTALLEMQASVASQGSSGASSEKASTS